jgi:hypothetical protein
MLNTYIRLVCKTCPWSNASTIRQKLHLFCLKPLEANLRTAVSKSANRPNVVSYQDSPWAGIPESVSRLATVWTARGSNSLGGKIFRTRPDRTWDPPSPLYNGHWVFPGVKRPVRSLDYPPPSSAEVKERVELYLYSTSGPSCFVIGWPYQDSPSCTRLHRNFSPFVNVGLKVKQVCGFFFKVGKRKGLLRHQSPDQDLNWYIRITKQMCLYCVLSLYHELLLLCSYTPGREPWAVSTWDAAYSRSGSTACMLVVTSPWCPCKAHLNGSAWVANASVSNFAR